MVELKNGKFAGKLCISCVVKFMGISAAAVIFV